MIQHLEHVLYLEILFSKNPFFLLNTSFQNPILFLLPHFLIQCFQNNLFFQSLVHLLFLQSLHLPILQIQQHIMMSFLILFLIILTQSTLIQLLLILFLLLINFLFLHQYLNLKGSPLELINHLLIFMITTVTLLLHMCQLQLPLLGHMIPLPLMIQVFSIPSLLFYPMINSSLVIGHLLLLCPFLKNLNLMLKPSQILDGKMQ